MEINENRIYDVLEKAGIPYEVLRTEEGWLEIGFCIGIEHIVTLAQDKRDANLTMLEETTK